MSINSRLLGVHSVDLPPRKAFRSDSAATNVAGIMLRSERGPDEVTEITSTPNFARMFGDYVKGYYGRYVVDGFFANLRGVPAKLLVKRFVPDDAVVAVENVPHGAGALVSITTLLNELKAGFNIHIGLTTVHKVADTANKVTSLNAVDKATAIALANNLKIAFNAHNRDAISTAPTYHAATGTDYSVTAPSATDIDSLIVLANQIKAKYTAHIADATAHTVADTANTIGAADAGFVASPINKLTLKAGYRGKEDKGAWGNNLAYSIKSSTRFQADIAKNQVAGSDTLVVESITGFEVGDLVSVYDPKNSKIEGLTVKAKDGSSKTLTFTSNTANAYDAGDGVIVSALTFDLTIYKKNPNGVIKTVEVWNKLTVASGVTNYVVDTLNNKILGSQYVIATDLGKTGVTDPLQQNPYEIDTPKFFSDTLGSDGTEPTNDDWNKERASFDNSKNVRFLANAESVSDDVNIKGDEYCAKRGDCIFMANFAPDLTKKQLIVKGRTYQKNDESYMMNNAQWLQVSDPIGKGQEPRINIPNVGHVLGNVIHRIVTFGYQRVPAGPQVAITGVAGIHGDQILNNADRTELADTGINCIQFMPSVGVVLRNARMASTDKTNAWFNQRFMRIIYKKTFEEMFALLENDSNGEDLLRRIYFTVDSFMRDDFTGNARTGGKPAFFITRKADGSMSTYEEAVQIIADETNNELADVSVGRANVQLFFTPPPPAEDIQLGVGISLVLAGGE